MRKQRRKLASAFSAPVGNQRDQFPVEPRFANQQACGDGHAHPAVFQNVDGQRGSPGGEFRSRCSVAINVQVIVHSRERRLDRRGLRLALDRISALVQRSILLNR